MSRACLKAGWEPHKEMMDLLSSTDLLAAFEPPGVVLDEKRCLHNLSKRSTCEQCFSVCPAQAIQPGKPPALNPEACEKCLACLPVCPSGAFQADDSVSALLDCLARLEARRVELVCQAHAQAGKAVPGVDAALRVHGCLAGIGVGGYLELAAMDVKAIIPRLDSCEGCSWGALQGQVITQIETAQRILESWGWAGVLAIAWPEAAYTDTQRPVWDVHNPPISRRDFFRLVTRQSQMAIAHLLNQKEGRTAERGPNKDRLRSVAALRHLQPPAQPSGLEGLGFYDLEANLQCTACGACAATCPTGALVFQRSEEKSFSLSIFPSRCTGCELCQEVCAAQALALAPDPAGRAVFLTGEPLLLQEGALARCERCSTLMAARPGSKLCPVCEFRRKNPLGSALPPGYKKRS
jgi:ferredoxin